MRLVRFIIILSIIAISTQPAIAQEKANTYSTWDSIELDTIASAWLIKRFIDHEAEFKFYPKGEFITEGIAFDTPDAEFRRTQSQSTFESIVSKYKIIDPAVLEIGRIMHDIEINYWNRQLAGVSEKVEKQVQEIIDSNSNKHICLDKGLQYFDSLYKELAEKGRVT